MKAAEFLRGPGAKPGRKAFWDNCARCGRAFGTDSVEERFFDPKGVICRECAGVPKPLLDRPATKENVPD